VPEVHHEYRPLGRVDVIEYIPRHGHDIRHLAGLQGAHILVHAEQLRGLARPREQCRGGAHPETCHEPKFHGIHAMRVHASVGAKGDGRADSQRGLEHRLVRGRGGACLGGDLRRGGMQATRSNAALTVSVLFITSPDQQIRSRRPEF